MTGVPLKVLKRVMKEGKITLQIETLDDLWHLYNIVDSGDRVISRTTRRIRMGDDNSRKQESVRKPMTLVIDVEDVAFHSFTNRVRLKGTIVEGPSDLVSTGSYHTFNIETGDRLTIIKEHWPDFHLKRIKEAQESRTSPIALLVTIEDENAEIFLLADYGIREAVSIKSSISRKRGDQKSYDATMREFFGDVALAVRSQLEQNNIGVLIIAGPGFVKDHFRDYLESASISEMPQVVVESANTVGMPAAKEILYRGVVSKVAEEIKLEKETQLVEKILEHIAKGDGLATYGDEEVARAVQYGAVDELLVTDRRLRGSDEQHRRKIDKLIRGTEKTKGGVNIISTEHPAGDQLQSLGGLAAILRFRIGQ